MNVLQSKIELQGFTLQNFYSFSFGAYEACKSGGGPNSFENFESPDRRKGHFQG